MAERVTFIKTGGGGYYEEKKSRFIAAVYSISSEEEAASYVEAARKNIGMQGITVMLLLLEITMKL